MPAVINEQVVDETTTANLKMLGDMAQTAMGVSIQNTVANQQALQAMVNANLQNGLTLAQSNLQAGLDLSRAVLARGIRFTFDTSAEEAVGFAKQIGADLSSKLADIEATLAAGQQAEKTANTTPPQTGTGGAFGSETGLSQQIAVSLANLAASQAAILELLKKP